jgi:toxin-antitoxin system PIN domain toxin
VSYSFDVNLMIYAASRQSPEHERAEAFLRSCAAGPEPLCLAWPTLISFIRLSTHPRILSVPLSPAEAMQNVEQLLALPHVRTLSEQDGFRDVYRDVSRDVAARGSLVPDAHLAAILKQHEIGTFYTNDADFRRFPFLRVKNPLL